MHNRVIKGEFASSEKINSLNDFQFRLWVHLITYVDDYGRGDARPQIIKGTCFPLRERITCKDIEKGLADLAGAGCVCLYNVDGKPYLYFPNWEKHQRVRKKVSRYPSPDAKTINAADCGELPQIAADCGELPQMAARIQNPESRIQNPNPEDIMAGEPPTRNVRPTVEQVALYCQERGNSVDPQRFVDYYTANGWKVGKNPMKDWKAAVRNWEKSDSGGKRKDVWAAPGAVDPMAKKAIERLIAQGKVGDSCHD